LDYGEEYPHCVLWVKTEFLLIVIDAFEDYFETLNIFMNIKN